MNRILRTWLVFVGLAAIAGWHRACVAEGFTGIVVEPPFDAVFARHGILMEFGGAKIVVNPDGSRLVIGVGRAAFDSKSPALQRLKSERLARNNAFRELTAHTSPVQIVHRERIEEKSRIVTVDGVEQRGEAIQEYLSFTTSAFEAVVKDLPEIGRWYSAEGDMLYIAIGKEFPGDAKRRKHAVGKPPDASPQE